MTKLAVVLLLFLGIGVLWSLLWLAGKLLAVWRTAKNVAAFAMHGTVDPASANRRLQGMIARTKDGDVDVDLFKKNIRDIVAAVWPQTSEIPWKDLKLRMPEGTRIEAGGYFGEKAAYWHANGYPTDGYSYEVLALSLLCAQSQDLEAIYVEDLCDEFIGHAIKPAAEHKSPGATAPVPPGPH